MIENTIFVIIHKTAHTVLKLLIIVLAKSGLWEKHVTINNFIKMIIALTVWEGRRKEMELFGYVAIVLLMRR